MSISASVRILCGLICPPVCPRVDTLATIGAMTIVLCAETADPGPILTRESGSRCIYLTWGPIAVPASGAERAVSAAILTHWELRDISLNPPAPETFEDAKLIVSSVPASAWREVTGAATAEHLRRAVLASATLMLLGPTAVCAGEWCADGLPGLGLIANTLILHNVQAGPGLRQVLAALSTNRARLLALDGPACVEYDPNTDSVTVSGGGSVLLASFIQVGGGAQPSARLHVLTAGMASGWPA